MEQHLITMTNKELSRYGVIQRLLNKEINGTEAAKQLDLSVRQTKNLKAKVKKSGVKGIIHRNRGKTSNRRISENKNKEMKKIIKKNYPDFGPLFASEKLKENHGIKIGKETLRQLMIKWKLWNPKPRKDNKEYRSWRPRKEQYGEMQQFDGSYEYWFEGRAPKCCLLASIDDATGKITKLQFAYDEGTIPVFSFWKEYFEKHGKPLNIYLDKLRTYYNNLKSALDDKEMFTQFQRAIKQELNTNLIYAHSPQAKGRIERLFDTLQDRLIKELRLAGISTIEQANRFVEEVFIPKFNTKFAVLAQKKGNLHKPLTMFEKDNLDKILAVQKTRIVNNDFTIKFEGKWYQLSEKQPSLVLRKDRVVLEQRIDGSMHISLRNKYLDYVVLPARPEKIKMNITGLTRKKSDWKPPIDHPWRGPFLIEKNKVEQLVSVN